MTAHYTQAEWLGMVDITPDAAIAGEYGTWKIQYRVGASGIDEGGRIRLRWRSVSDWATPQFSNPAAPDFATIHTSTQATLTSVFGVTAVRPWTKTLTIRVSEEALAPGDDVLITLGNRAGGSPGMRPQTFPESPFTFKFDVDPFGTAIYQHLEDLELMVTGGAATQLVVVAPSDAVTGTPSWLQVRALDLWGNPDPNYAGTVRFRGEIERGLPESYTFSPDDGGVHWFRDVQYRAGVLARVTVIDDRLAASATSNPIRCHNTEPAQRTYWADLHGQTGETVGTGTISGFFTYARDVAAVQAAAHQGNDFQITQELWDYLCEQVEEFHDPGEFITLHGSEWSGNTPAGGDHNVYLKHPEALQRSSHAEIDDTSDIENDRYPITELYAVNVGRDDMLIVPHIGGRRADIQWHEPSLEPVIEIASQWGRFEWFAKEALERGYQVGFSGGSDDHSARQGWSAPTLAHHGVRGGLTAFVVPELTREALWDALKNRRIYGTSGPRMLLDVTANGHPIGSAFETTDSQSIEVDVVGTAPLDSVELRRGVETVYTWSGMDVPDEDDPVRIRIAWSGARNRGRSRALDWSGILRIWNGSITGVENYAIDSPLDGVQFWDSNSVAWHSHTCGDRDGIILDLEATDRTLFDFQSPTMQMRFTLADLLDGERCWSGPGLEQEVQVRRLPQATGPLEARFSWQDESPLRGINPYWIWVTQADGELGWSSPIYVSYAAPD